MKTVSVKSVRWNHETDKTDLHHHYNILYPQMTHCIFRSHYLFTAMEKILLKDEIYFYLMYIQISQEHKIL